MKALKVGLKIAKKFLKLAKIPLLLADALLKVIEKIVEVGIKIAESVAKAALQDVLQFHYFCISADLGGTDGLCVSFNMSISILKREMSMGGGLCINGKIFDSMGKLDFHLVC